eukprot:CAMPEP_0184666614 /NCGR_PEP_ID=MMETSP0308-20130426/62739_1 /TAXON_ID=38269 /ORGANISM="Gloeochaete witrockiana, Strain SAG 46.84" /LENGTH=49 /DNA_ID= /DNA_START= /DNA_END= /DNA_ORIENTATION=
MDGSTMDAIDINLTKAIKPSAWLHAFLAKLNDVSTDETFNDAMPCHAMP